jgi:hypothetical protein
MKNFTKINDLPIIDLEDTLDDLLERRVLSWTNDLQICINCTKKNSSDYTEGSGSLVYDWKNQTKTINNKGHEEILVPKIQNPKQETDFQYICDVFKGTKFEIIYNTLKQNYNVGRVRLMKSRPKTCLSWHTDYHTRIHFPIKTQKGCFMVIEDEVCHLSKGHWWMSNTTTWHTAVNASKKERIHLVATVVS